MSRGGFEEPFFFFVINQKDEKAMAVVPSIDVVFEDGVKKSDIVKYFWNKKECQGEVVFISEDYEKCGREARRLNDEQKAAERRKLEQSFHREKPRSSKIKCLQGFNAIIGGKKSSSQEQGQPAAKKTKEQDPVKSSIDDIDAKIQELIRRKSEQQQQKGYATHKVRQCIYSSDSDEEKEEKEEKEKDDEEGDDIDATQKVEEDLLLEREGDGKTAEDLADTDSENESKNTANNSARQDASAAGNSGTTVVPSLGELGNTSASGSEAQLTKNEIADQLLKKFDHETLQKLLNSRSGFELPKSFNGVPSGSGNQQQTEKPRMIYGMDNKYSRQMYHEDASSGQLLKDGIFCATTQYAMAEKAVSTTMAARRMMDGVFDFRALASCSLTGLPPRCKGREAYKNKPSEVKPFLCPVAVNAIVEKALELQKEFHWPKKDPTQIRHAMSVRLSEARKQLYEGTL